MAYQTVLCEIRYSATVGHSGNELPPSKYEVLGWYESEGDAARALAEYGLTRTKYGWRSNSGYTTGYIERSLRELVDK